MHEGLNPRAPLAGETRTKPLRMINSLSSALLVNVFFSFFKANFFSHLAVVLAFKTLLFLFVFESSDVNTRKKK